ncbi:hypothetical protein GCM10009733_023850 [Nonomuraea maheshkhaliensis]|uniref:Resolvase/invertase-type recombinase catalytic domain-containing protein n=1 Tax=Nonomuraea maheshkhaliensis TaxID=419590 RepID=A0ABP4QXF6_9ACTN
MEKESGKRGVARPAWESLLALPKAGDTLKFWKSDRWGRTAGHVLTTVNELRDHGIHGRPTVPQPRASLEARPRRRRAASTETAALAGSVRRSSR